MLLALTLASCSDDYNDWAAPQTNPQEEAITISGFSAAAVPVIDLGTVSGDKVAVFSLNAGTLPEGYTLSKAQLELVPVDGKGQYTIATTLEGEAAVADLTEMVEAAFGKRPELRVFDAQVILNADCNGQSLRINAGDVKLQLMPAASNYTVKYYIVGKMQGWDATNMSCALYPHDQFVYSYTTRYDDDANLKIWSEDTFGNWNLAYGCAAGADHFTEGDFVQNGGAIVCPEPGSYYTFTADFSTMHYTWTKCDDQNPATFTQMGLVGGMTGWADGADIVMTQTSPCNWYADLTLAEETELKFRADGAWDNNWGTEINVGETFYGTGTPGGKNIKVPAGNYAVYFNNITGRFVFVAK